MIGVYLGFVAFSNTQYHKQTNTHLILVLGTNITFLSLRKKYVTVLFLEAA